MIIKQGEFVSFTPSELHTRSVIAAPARPRKSTASAKRAQAKAEASAARSDLLDEVERLIRANERLTLERDQLRDVFSRQSLEARHAKLTRTKPKHVDENLRQHVDENLRQHVDENLRRKLLEPAPAARETVTPESAHEDADEPGLELARVVVNWFWEDADDASVRLVHDALTGQGIRTLVREAE